jgi:guanine deaminase
VAVSRIRAGLLSFDSSRTLRYFPDAYLEIGADGRLAAVEPRPRRVPAGTRDRRPWIAIPGLIDAHCHLSQYPAVARDGLELLPWLKTNIFPLERKFRGERARNLARRFFADLAAHGTTTAAVYTSIWQDSTQVCFEEAEASGLRVIMGKVMMDRGSYDDGFARRHRTISRGDFSLKESEELCRRWHGAAGGRILYAYTPRFALSCSFELMKKTAEAAARRDARVQTHLAENHDEVALIGKLFPGMGRYAGVYDRAGLVGERTVLAHAIWLSEGEYRVLEKRRPAVAFCPTSNAFLRSGIMNAGRMRRGDIPLSIGSDVAGGPTLDLFEVMRQAVYSQRVAFAHGLFPGAPAATPENAFYMATMGGAEALRLPGVGLLEKGKHADLVLLDPRAYRAPEAPEPRAAAEAVSELVYRANRSCVRAAYVAGRAVFTSAAGRP